MKKSFLFILWLLFNLNTTGQVFEPFMGTGIGQSNQNELKDMFQGLTETSPFPIQTTSNFPAFPNYELGVNYHFPKEKWIIGVSINLFSTGANANVHDYSGSYTLKCLTNALWLKETAKRKLVKLKNFECYISSSLGYLLSDINFNDKLNTNSINSSSSIGFRSKSLMIGANVELIKTISRYGIFINAGYNYDTMGILYQKEENNARLTFDGLKVHTNWGGFQTKVGFLFKL
jgi:hypothetical protein